MCAEEQDEKLSFFLFKQKGTRCEKAKRVVVIIQRERRLLHVFFLFFPSPDLIPCWRSYLFCKPKTECSSPYDLHFLVLFTVGDVPCGHN